MVSGFFFDEEFPFSVFQNKKKPKISGSNDVNEINKKALCNTSVRCRFQFSVAVSSPKKFNMNRNKMYQVTFFFLFFHPLTSLKFTFSSTDHLIFNHKASVIRFQQIFDINLIRLRIIIIFLLRISKISIPARFRNF